MIIFRNKIFKYVYNIHLYTFNDLQLITNNMFQTTCRDTQQSYYRDHRTG